MGKGTGKRWEFICLWLQFFHWWSDLTNSLHGNCATIAHLNELGLHDHDLIWFVFKEDMQWSVAQLLTLLLRNIHLISWKGSAGKSHRILDYLLPISSILRNILTIQNFNKNTAWTRMKFLRKYDEKKICQRKQQVQKIVNAGFDSEMPSVIADTETFCTVRYFFLVII